MSTAPQTLTTLLSIDGAGSSARPYDRALSVPPGEITGVAVNGEPLEFIDGGIPPFPVVTLTGPPAAYSVVGGRVFLHRSYPAGSEVAITFVASGGE